MNKTLILLGASIITQGMMFSAAEARLVRYEINGKQYSYSTNNRAQTAEAKKRIAAAKAVEAAKAKAVAEKSKNPLTAAFGSTAQTEAKEAQERLEHLLEGPTEYMAVSVPSREPTKKPQETKDTKPRQEKPYQATVSKTPDISKAPEKSVVVVRTPAKPILASAASASLVIAEPVDPQRRTKVKSVSFDIQSGIKTTIMLDGTIEEEPFDSSTLSVLAPEPEKTNSLMAFVKQLRKVAPEEATGSIRTSTAEPEDGSLIRHR